MNNKVVSETIDLSDISLGEKMIKANVYFEGKKVAAENYHCKQHYSETLPLRNRKYLFARHHFVQGLSFIMVFCTKVRGSMANQSLEHWTIKQ